MTGASTTFGDEPILWNLTLFLQKGMTCTNMDRLYIN